MSYHIITPYDNPNDMESNKSTSWSPSPIWPVTTKPHAVILGVLLSPSSTRTTVCFSDLNPIGKHCSKRSDRLWKKPVAFLWSTIPPLISLMPRKSILSFINSPASITPWSMESAPYLVVQSGRECAYELETSERLWRKSNAMPMAILLMTKNLNSTLPDLN